MIIKKMGAVVLTEQQPFSGEIRKPWGLHLYYSTKNKERKRLIKGKKYQLFEKTSRWDEEFY